MLPQYWAHPSGRNTPWYQAYCHGNNTLLYNNLSLPIADRHQFIVNSHHLNTCTATEQFSTAGIVIWTSVFHMHRFPQARYCVLAVLSNYSAPPSLEWNSACRPPSNATSHIEQQKAEWESTQLPIVDENCGWKLCLGSMKIPYLIGGFYLEYMKNTIVHSGHLVSRLQPLIFCLPYVACCRIFWRLELMTSSLQD